MKKIEIVNLFNSKLREEDFIIDNAIVELAVEYLTDLGYKNPEKFIEYLIQHYPELFVNLYKRMVKHFCVKYSITTLSKNNQILMYYVSD